MKSAICFFDDYWLDVKRGMQRRWFKPTLSGTYVDPEFKNGVYPSIHWCPEVGKYRLWYEVLPKFTVDALRYLALAESTDGRNWRPITNADSSDPASEGHPHVVYSGKGGVHGTSVFRDPFEANPDRLYKAAGMTRTYADGRRPRTLAVRLSVSPDGVHWTEENSIHPYTSDALNCLFYNPFYKKYSLLLRAAYVDRRIFQKNTNDPTLQSGWDSPMLVVHPDSGYVEPVQLYSMWGGYNEGLFLGLLMRYYIDMHDVDYSTMTGYMDSELMYSYDGFNWMHTDREPLIERNLPQEHGQCALVLTGMTTNDDGSKHVLVATGSRFMHTTGDVFERLLAEHNVPAHKFFFYEIRKDGFVGLENCGFNGLATTKTIELLKADITVNISIPFGKLRCAILSPEGKPVAGFDYDDCIPFTGDDVNMVPVWKEHALDELVGKRIRLSFEVSCGILYAVHATMRPSIRVAQESFGNAVQLYPERGVDDVSKAT
jgi:hypothetical protein